MPPDPVDVAVGAKPTLDHLIAQDAKVLSAQLTSIRQRLFPPTAQKTLRRFSSGEAATLIGISDAYLRQLSLAGGAPEPDKTPAGRRSYSLEQINDIRRTLQRFGARDYVPVRQGGEHLQILSITNFKGGSGKTTTTAHLAQYLALRGYRVLAIDLDPQSSLSALLGYQPETDVGENETFYGALRYDDRRRPLSEISKKTYFAGLDIVPGNLELQEFEHEPFVGIRRRVGKRIDGAGMLEDAGDVLQAGVRKVGVFVAGEQRLVAFPDRLVAVHPRAVVAIDRLRHEGCGFAVDLRDLLDAVLVDLHLLGHAHHRRKFHAQFVLRRADLVMVLLHLYAHPRHRREHF